MSDAPGRARARRLPSAALAVALVVTGVALLAWGARSEGVGSTTPEPAVVATPATSSSSNGVEATPSEEPTPTEPPPTKPHPAAGAPRSVVVPALGIDAPVVGIPVVDSVLTPPADPQTLGWWQDGAAPGDLKGGALITGHTVSSGGGALDDLEQLEEGDVVRVRTAQGTIGYDVLSVRIFRKASLAANAERVFSQEVPGRLVLITCEDWDGERYLSNVVVVAQPRWN